MGLARVMYTIWIAKVVLVVMLVLVTLLAPRLLFQSAMTSMTLMASLSGPLRRVNINSSPMLSMGDAPVIQHRCTIFNTELI